LQDVNDFCYEGITKHGKSYHTIYQFEGSNVSYYASNILWGYTRNSNARVSKYADSDSGAPAQREESTAIRRQRSLSSSSGEITAAPVMMVSSSNSPGTDKQVLAGSGNPSGRNQGVSGAAAIAVPLRIDKVKGAAILPLPKGNVTSWAGIVNKEPTNETIKRTPVQKTQKVDTHVSALNSQGLHKPKTGGAGAPPKGSKSDRNLRERTR
jgi:hypothetical protein